MDKQEPSSSSSGQQQEMDKVEDKQVEKKLKEELQNDNENQIEMEAEDKCFIDELPPEMLLQIFNCLNVKSLVRCRLVSRKWNGLARQIIQSRDNVVTYFVCPETEDENLTFEGLINPTADLENFINYFEDSKESPLYTRFFFFNFEPSCFDHADWIKFISEFGKNVKSLKFEVLVDNFDDLMELVEKLRNLLLNQLPNLQVFGLILPDVAQPNVTPHPREIQLFPTTTPKSNEETAKASIQLPHLKVFYLCEHSFSDYTEIFTDLLNAAVNLQRIEFFDGDNSHGVIDSCHFLHSLGKLHCLQTAFIDLDTELLSKLKENPSFPLAFKLKKLTLSVEDSVYKNCWSSAAVFISRLFESSKDTLTELGIGLVGFLSALKIPKFPKLTSLTIEEIGTVIDVEEIKVQDLLSGREFNQVFPLLQHLFSHIPWAVLFPRDENQDPNVSCLSNLKNLTIPGLKMTKEDISRISQVCPNLKEFRVSHLDCGGSGRVGDFSQVGNAIWTHMKQLESLHLAIKVNSPNSDFATIDSCFTGFSRDACIHLYDLIKAEELSKEHGSSQIKISELEAERTTPAIFDLKDLKNLRITLFMPIQEDEKNPNSSREALAVSEKYASQLMENLEYRVEKLVANQ